jgi:hypothetical protein
VSARVEAAIDNSLAAEAAGMVKLAAVVEKGTVTAVVVVADTAVVAGKVVDTAGMTVELAAAVLAAVDIEAEADLGLGRKVASHAEIAGTGEEGVHMGFVHAAAEGN